MSTAAAIIPSGLFEFERDQDIARLTLEVRALERDVREAGIVKTIAEAPVEITGEQHTPDGIAEARARYNALAGGLVATEYELEQLQAEQQHDRRARGSVAMARAPVVRPRIAARSRERREHRNGASSSRAGPDDPDPPDPPLGGALSAARGWAA